MRMVKAALSTPVPPVSALVLLAAGAISFLLTTVANAGQRRVEVGFGGNFFSPSNTTLNVGDHVTWVWAGGGHTVTNGTDPTDPNAGQDFDSGFLNGANQAMTWHCDVLGTIPYYCDPHRTQGMTGSLQVSALGVNVASFRISEVQYNAAGNLDRIEIANLGNDSGDLGRYRIAINGTTAITIPTSSILVLSGATPGRVVIHTNQSGTNTPTSLFMPTIGNLPDIGSVALYAPTTVAAEVVLTDETQLIDFVQWGAGNQANSATAFLAGVWPAVADFVPAVPALGDYDLAFCGNSTQRGVSFWNVAHPNFNSQAICATPTQASSWGRIKLLYR